KLDVKGRDCGKLLDKVYAGRLSDLRPGRVRYAVLCDEAGIMLDDATVSRLADDHYFITTTTGNLEFVEQWLEWWQIGAGWDVHITNLTGGLAALNLAGPKARNVLAKLTSCELNTKAFSYMACRREEVGGVEALLMRIGFVGETGWEIHFPAESGAYLWRALLEAGRDFDIRPVGVEAQRLLRLEKRHVIVGVDTDALTNPFEAGMGWVAKLDKEDFIGRAALLRLSGEEPHQSLAGFIMNEESLPEDGAAILVNGKLVGRVTSARYSPLNRKAVGLAWIPPELTREGEEIDVRVGAAWLEPTSPSRRSMIRRASAYGCKEDLPIKQTTLFNRHQQNGASWIEQHGWQVPAYFSKPEDEAARVRESVGLADLSWMLKFDVKGYGLKNTLALGEGVFSWVLEIGRAHV